jgi:hypothetical protein
MFLATSTLFFLFIGVLWLIKVAWDDGFAAAKRAAAAQAAEDAAERYADAHDGWGPYGPSDSFRKLTATAAMFSPEAAALDRKFNEWEDEKTK